MAWILQYIYLMKATIEIKVNSYTTLDFTSEVEGLFPHHGNKKVFKVQNGASINLIKPGMGCLVEVPGRKSVPGRIEGITHIDGASAITVLCSKEA
jgi:hypothetical protein